LDLLAPTSDLRVLKIENVTRLRLTGNAGERDECNSAVRNHCNIERIKEEWKKERKKRTFIESKELLRG
jgi:hypothetical protein